VEQGETAAVHD